jgi:hypothetical protein
MRKTKKYMNIYNITPNANLNIPAILKKVHKQKQMVYMGYVENISAFGKISCICKYIGGFLKDDFGVFRQK